MTPPDGPLDASTGASVDTGLLWRRPERLGHQETLKGLGGIVAPLLAGFSLSTIALLVAADHPPHFSGPAIFALAGAAAMLLYSMQVAFLALEHKASPADWLAWYPEATVNKQSLQEVRLRQAREHERVLAFERRHAFTYELGLQLFLLGLLLLVWPVWHHGDFSIWRLAAAILVLTAFGVEVWWMIARLYNARAELRHSTTRMPAPTPWPDVAKLTIGAPSATGLAAVLDPDRRKAVKLDYPDLSAEPGRDAR